MQSCTAKPSPLHFTRRNASLLLASFLRFDLLELMATILIQSRPSPSSGQEGSWTGWSGLAI